jgi:hypothetical protein
MCSLGLKYVEGYDMPDFKVKIFVFPTHLSLDIHYVRNFGEKEGYQKFKEDLLQQLSARARNFIKLGSFERVFVGT